MIYVSMVEIFVKATDGFKDAGESENDAYLYGTLSFFGGIALNAALGKLTDLLEGGEASPVVSDPAIPELEVSSGADPVKTPDAIILASGDSRALPTKQPEDSQTRLMQMGLKTAVAIGIHNFPEGLATFVGTLDDPAVGGALAVAIAIHNIPEGICVAMPVFYATGSRRKAFLWAFISGISEPVGAGLGWLVLYNTMNDYVYGAVFGVVGGMMVHISVKELVPTALKYDKEHTITHNGICLGFFVMALSLVLFKY